MTEKAGSMDQCSTVWHCKKRLQHAFLVLLMWSVKYKPPLVGLWIGKSDTLVTTEPPHQNQKYLIILSPYSIFRISINAFPSWDDQSIVICRAATLHRQLFAYGNEYENMLMK